MILSFYQFARRYDKYLLIGNAYLFPFLRFIYLQRFYAIYINADARNITNIFAMKCFGAVKILFVYRDDVIAKTGQKFFGGIIEQPILF